MFCSLGPEPLGEGLGTSVGPVVGRAEGATLGPCVGAAVGQPALCAWDPRQLFVEPRCRYFFPKACATPTVLDCDDGVFCVVLHAGHEDQPL